MPFQRVPYAVEVNWIWDYLGKPLQNSPNFQTTAVGYTVAAKQALASAVDSWVHTQMKPLVADDITYLRTEVRGLNTEFDTVEIDFDNAGPGFRVGAMNPLNVALSIKLGSGLTGRSARGRMFTFGSNEGDLNVANRQTFGVTYRNAWVLAIQTLFTAAAAMGWTPVVVSRFHEGVKRPEAITFAITQVVLADINVDSQRQRLL